MILSNIYKAVIFDFFGTLTKGKCAPEDKIVAEWNLDKRSDFNYSFIEDVVCGTACETPFTGEQRTKYFETLIDKLKLPKNSKPRLREIFKEDIDNETLVWNAIEIIKWIKNKGLKLGMVSDIPNPDYDLAKKFGFHKIFDFRHLSYDPEWINSNNYRRVLKPEPKIFERIVKELGTNYDNTLMVGNSLHSDIEPARKLGIRAILVDYKRKSPQNRDRIESLEELKKSLQVLS